MGNEDEDDGVTAPETPAAIENHNLKTEQAENGAAEERRKALIDRISEGMDAVAGSDKAADAELARAALVTGRDPARYATTDGKPPRHGFDGPLSPAPAPLGPDGQHEAYWILSDAERAKGFVRPVRRSYKHVGIQGPVHPTRDLDAVEQRMYGPEALGPAAFVKYEAYPPGGTSTGRFWTAAELARVGAGCGRVTTMGKKIAETYAREPGFYGSTMCVHCGDHFPVGERGEFVWVGEASGFATSERVGT